MHINLSLSLSHTYRFQLTYEPTVGTSTTGLGIPINTQGHSIYIIYCSRKDDNCTISKDLKPTPSLTIDPSQTSLAALYFPALNNMLFESNRPNSLTYFYYAEWCHESFLPCLLALRNLDPAFLLLLALRLFLQSLPLLGHTLLPLLLRLLLVLVSPRLAFALLAFLLLAFLLLLRAGLGGVLDEVARWLGDIIISSSYI